MLSLQAQLESNSHAIAMREKQVDNLEYELSKRMEVLKEEYERKMVEANEVMERMKDDFAHKYVHAKVEKL